MARPSYPTVRMLSGWRLGFLSTASRPEAPKLATRARASLSSRTDGPPACSSSWTRRRKAVNRARVSGASRVGEAWTPTDSSMLKPTQRTPRPRKKPWISSGKSSAWRSSTESTLYSIPWRSSSSSPFITASKVPLPRRVTRLRSWMKRGPSRLTPTRAPSSRKKAHQPSSISMPLVWNCWVNRDPPRSSERRRALASRYQETGTVSGSPACQSSTG